MAVCTLAGLLALGGALVVDGSAAAQPKTPQPVDIGVGASPLAIAADPTTGLVYAANSDSFLDRTGSVSVIDGNPSYNGEPNTGKVIATITVGKNPWGVAVNPRTDMVYVSNQGSNSVSVIDGRTDRVVATVGVGARPLGVGVAPAKDLIYVANGGDGKSRGTVSVIDGHTNRVVGTVPVGYGPSGIGVNTISSTVYVGNEGGAGPSTYYSGTVSVIRGTQALATVNLDATPAGIAVDQATNDVYVANSVEEVGGSADVGVINASNRLVAQIPLQSPDPNGVAVDAARHGVFVAQQTSGNAGGPVGSVSVINTNTNGLVANISVGGNPWGATVDATTGRVYLANDTSPGTVSMLDFSTYTVSGGTPPRRITAPLVPPQAPPPPPAPKATPKPAPTPLPPGYQPPAAGTMCALLDASGGASLGGGYPLIAGTVDSGGNGPVSRTNVACEEYNSLRSIDFEKTTTSYPPGVKPSSPSGLGTGAELYVVGPPYQSDRVVIWFHHGAWYGLTVQLVWPAAPTLADVTALEPSALTVARKIYGSL
jgi:YVTN family beta-propeller protein